MGRVEDSVGRPKMINPTPPKDEFDFVKNAKAVRNSPAFCRVPGELPPMGKMTHEQNTLKAELKKKSLVELKDLLASNQKIASNATLLNRLPDRGAKVKEKLAILKSLVEERERGNELAEAMAALHLPDTDAMEWNTKSAAMKAPDALTVMDQTLKVLAEGSLPSTNPTDSDNTTPADDLNDQHQHYLTHKVGVLDTVAKEDRFVPVASLHNTDLQKVKPDLPVPNLPSSSHQSTCSRNNAKVKTEAIPLPKYSNATTRQLSLQESLRIQREQAEKLREATVRQAAARLAAKSSAKPAQIKSEGGDKTTRTTVETIVDTRWRDTTFKEDDETEEGLDEGRGEDEALRATAEAALNLDSDDDSQNEHDDNES
eukprot:TRINITY_DN16208_c0_g1_i2.p1 TRINITY_DN16208_c0_g1~~TRINITY_DN16208_c0_g1_i2.p1  ORF type:complete len:371 (+),score=114.93 TRINITY_DN16208_c0_g1_i2:40-1152(+)